MNGELRQDAQFIGGEKLKIDGLMNDNLKVSKQKADLKSAYMEIDDIDFYLANKNTGGNNLASRQKYYIRIN